MNVIFFCRFFYPHIGGVEKHILKVSNILKKTHTITVITEQYDKKLPLIESYRGITIYRIPLKVSGKNKKYEIWDFLYKNMKIINNADVVHVHDVFFWYLPFRFMYPGKKVYVTFHGYEGNELPTKKAILSHKLAEVLSKGNICIGDYLKIWYGTRPSVVSYGGVDFKKSIPNNTSNHLSSKKTLKILYIGRLEKEAGIMEYLLLVKELQQVNHRINLLVLGDGSQKKQAERFVQKNNLKVTFGGFVERVEPFIPKADIVFTSRYLGTMESMLYKKPVLCVYNNDIKRDCFTLAPFHEWIYMAATQEELLKRFMEMINLERQRERKVNQAFEWVSEQTWERMADNYNKLWGSK